MSAPVLDCSVVCAWLLDDESVPEADAALEAAGRHGGLAPGLWWAELRNALVMAERRSRLSPAQTAEALAEIEALGVTLDHTPDSGATLRLAREHRITIYDALYVELAIRKQRQLATLDHALRQAAEAEGIDIL
ncbi:MAG: type II toxin-antitoxin system VapC family toxin [Gammaproteobacteria bacterium]|nr:type II toxin-antitoxin system VapC family toxin [Gammaproteobacteria bacterium]MYI05935.1 type II toxin-antitoxin system VapC family toxin [Gemmatimonadota bacterium]